MYVLENVKGVVRGSEVIIEVGKPKIENGKVVDILPKEAFKIGDKEERRELINNFERARLNGSIYGIFSLATPNCPLRGYQGGCAVIDSSGRIGVVQKDDYGDAGYLLDIGAGRSDCPVEEVDNDGLARAILEGFQEIITYRLNDNGKVLMIPRIEGFGEQYQKRVHEDIIDEAKRLEEKLGFKFFDNEEFPITIIPPRNAVKFEIETLDDGVTEFDAGVSFESQYASFEPMFFIKHEKLIPCLMFRDGEFLPNGSPLNRRIHFIDIFSGRVRSYGNNILNSGLNEMGYCSFNDLKERIRKDRRDNNKPELDGMDFGTVKAQALLSKEAYPL